MVWIHTSSAAQAKLRMGLTGSYTTEVSTSMSDPGALQVGDWIRLDVQITVPVDYTTSSTDQGLTVRIDNSAGSAPAYFDDLLFYPVDGSFSGAVWDERSGRMTDAIGPEGFLTRYTYAADGSVILVEQETENGFSKVQENSFGFAKPF